MEQIQGLRADILQRLRDLGKLSLKLGVSSKSLHSGFRKPSEAELKKYKSKNGWSIPRKQDPLNQHGQSSCELIENKIAYIGPHRFAPVPFHIFYGSVWYFHGIPECK